MACWHWLTGRVTKRHVNLVPAVIPILFAHEKYAAFRRLDLQNLHYRGFLWLDQNGSLLDGGKLTGQRLCRRFLVSLGAPDRRSAGCLDRWQGGMTEVFRRHAGQASPESSEEPDFGFGGRNGFGSGDGDWAFCRKAAFCAFTKAANWRIVAAV